MDARKEGPHLVEDGEVAAAEDMVVTVAVVVAAEEDLIPDPDPGPDLQEDVAAGQALNHALDHAQTADANRCLKEDPIPHALPIHLRLPSVPPAQDLETTIDQKKMNFDLVITLNPTVVRIQEL